jgi:hypothetical protein
MKTPRVRVAISETGGNVNVFCATFTINNLVSKKKVNLSRLKNYIENQLTKCVRNMEK